MRRRGSFDPSDYAFGGHVREVGEILRAAEQPLDLEELARRLGRAGSLPGDALRAAYQIEGHEDKERGWELLAEQALRVLRRARVVEEGLKGWQWTKEGPDPLHITYDGRKLPIYAPEGKARMEGETERRYRLTPNPFTDHHLNIDRPLIDPKHGNLPGRVYDRLHVDTIELRQSLLAYGYVAQLPILVDEHGVTLDGRTRERLCEELREEFPERNDLVPAERTLELGDGPEGNAKRLKIALAANVGRRNLSTKTKQEVARYLYDERNWTYEQIAEALDVSEKTVRRLAAKGRAERNEKARPKRVYEQPEWQAEADPLIHEWIDGRLTRGDVAAELKARGLKGAHGTLDTRRAQIEETVPKTGTVPESGTAPENEAPQTPDQLDLEPTVPELLSYVIAVLEEDNAYPHLVERLRTAVMRLDGTIPATS